MSDFAKGTVLCPRILTIVLLLVLFLCCPSFLLASPPPVNHTQPQLIWPDLVEMVVETDDSVRSVRFYFLRPGMSEYQMRFMKPTGDGTFTYRFDTSTLESPTIQYYFELRTAEGVYLYPGNAPNTPLLIEDERDGIELDLYETPAKMDEEVISTGSITVNGSLEYSVSRDRNVTEHPVDGTTDTASDETMDGQDDTSRFAEKDFLADFNVRLAKSWEKGETSITFDTNLTYTNHALEGEQDGGISSIMLEVKRPHHQLRIGDLEIASTKLVGESLNTRGIGYQYSRGRITADVFYMNSRQSTVVEDSIPSGDNYITGINLGVDAIQDYFHIDMQYVTGKDDSSIATNSSGIDTEILEGSLFSIAPRITLFDKTLTFAGEYAESTSSKEIVAAIDDGTDTSFYTGFEDDTDTGFDDLRGSTWRVGAEFEKGPFKITGYHKYIGSDYQSLLNADELYFAVDRKGYDLNIEYSSDHWDVLMTWEDVRDNLDDDITKEWSRYQTVSITPVWRITDQLSVSVGHSNGQERSYEDKERTKRLSDSDMFGYQAGIDYSFNDSSAVQLSWSMDIAESFDSPEYDSVTNALTLNFSYYDDRFQFYPGVSYSQTDTDEELSELLNVYISGEYYLVPELLSVSTNDSFTWTKGEQTARTRLMSITANINWKLSWIHGVFSDTIFSIVGEYEEDVQEETTTESYSVSTKLDFMF